jgi:hypothetical protein
LERRVTSISIAPVDRTGEDPAFRVYRAGRRAAAASATGTLSECFHP